MTDLRSTKPPCESRSVLRNACPAGPDGSGHGELAVFFISSRARSSNRLATKVGSDLKARQSGPGFSCQSGQGSWASPAFAKDGPHADHDAGSRHRDGLAGLEQFCARPFDHTSIRDPPSPHVCIGRCGTILEKGASVSQKRSRFISHRPGERESDDAQATK